MMKKALWVALGLVLLGAGLFIWAMTALGWDFAKLSAVAYETNTHEIDAAFSGLSVQAGTADVALLPSEGDDCRVVCHERSDARHTVEVIDGVLTVKRSENGQPWYIGIDFDEPKISVYLPAGEYGTVEVQMSTGDVVIKSASAKALDIRVSTGDVSVTDAAIEANADIRVSTGDIVLTDVACERFVSAGSTGDILLTGVLAEGEMILHRSTGDVRLDGSDAASIEVKTNTGSVTGSLLTDKVFSVETRTGDIDVPNTSAGGTCKVETGTGDIRLTIAG